VDWKSHGILYSQESGHRDQNHLNCVWCLTSLQVTADMLLMLTYGCYTNLRSGVCSIALQCSPLLCHFITEPNVVDVSYVLVCAFCTFLSLVNLLVDPLEFISQPNIQRLVTQDSEKWLCCSVSHFWDLLLFCITESCVSIKLIINCLTLLYSSSSSSSSSSGGGN